MAKLRWSNPPRETDPARVLPEPRPVFFDRAASASAGGHRIGKGALAKKLIAAKLKHEKLTAQITAIRRRLREAKHIEQRAAKRDQRMVAKGRKSEPEAKKALRASQIAKDEKRLEAAIAAAHAIFEERVRLTAIWNGNAGEASE